MKTFGLSCFLVFVAWDAATVTGRRLNLRLTAADIERALVTARGTERERERFHAPYISQLNTASVQSVEIISPFRRMVLIAEQHILRGDRALAYSPRLAAEALEPWANRVSVVARLRFHPLNTYLTVPNVELLLDGANADTAFIGVRKEPVYALADPGGAAPLVGATAEGVYDATLIGQTRRNARVRLDGKDLAIVGLDFGSIE